MIKSVYNEDQLLDYIESVIRYQVMPNPEATDFRVELYSDGLLFIPRFPVTYEINDSFGDRLFNALNISLTPFFTVIRPMTMQIRALRTSELSSARGIWLPMRKGQSQRLHETIADLTSRYYQNGRIPIMDQISWDFDRSPHAIITGVSGSGKSYFMRILLELCSEAGQVIAIDPKVSDLARLARRNQNADVVIPNFTEGGITNGFLQTVIGRLRSLEGELYQRQQTLYDHGSKVSTSYRELQLAPIFVFIDEVAALLTGAEKKLRDSFQGLLTRIAVLGREAGVYLVLAMQSARAEYINTMVRDSLSLRVQLGRINSENTRFLFPELNEMPMIPLGGKGVGIISIAGDDTMAGIEPVATPTLVEDRYSTKEVQL